MKTITQSYVSTERTAGWQIKTEKFVLPVTSAAMSPSALITFTCTMPTSFRLEKDLSKPWRGSKAETRTCPSGFFFLFLNSLDKNLFPFACLINFLAAGPKTIHSDELFQMSWKMCWVKIENRTELFFVLILETWLRIHYEHQQISQDIEAINTWRIFNMFIFKYPRIYP